MNQMLIAILLINWQRLRLKHHKESLEQEKKIIETEVKAAKLQMEQEQVLIQVVLQV